MPRARWLTMTSSAVCLVLVHALLGINAVTADCWYDNQKHEEGTQVSTAEPCLNCTCSRGALLCYLRMCPRLPNPPPPGCILLHRYHSCCPELICTELPSGNGIQARSEPDIEIEEENVNMSNACVVNGSIYGPGSAMDSSTDCEYCYCLGGEQRCVRPRCLLPLDGCTPAYESNDCCPVHYNCTRNLFTTTTTTLSPNDFEAKGGCVVDKNFYPEGGKVLGVGHSICDNCYCLRGLVRCEPLSCAPPLMGCSPVIRAGECCAASYNCSGTIETQPEPFYGQIPIVSKEYAKLRKEVHHKRTTTLTKYKSENPEVPYYVIAETTKPRSQATTRQYNPPGLITQSPFYYNVTTNHTNTNKVMKRNGSLPEIIYVATKVEKSTSNKPENEVLTSTIRHKKYTSSVLARLEAESLEGRINRRINNNETEDATIEATTDMTTQETTVADASGDDASVADSSGSLAGASQGSIAGPADGSVAGAKYGNATGATDESVDGAISGAKYGSLAGASEGSVPTFGSVAGATNGSVAGATFGSLVEVLEGSVAGAKYESVAESTDESVAGATDESVAAAKYGSVAEATDESVAGVPDESVAGAKYGSVAGDTDETVIEGLAGESISEAIVSDYSINDGTMNAKAGSTISDATVVDTATAASINSDKLASDAASINSDNLTSDATPINGGTINANSTFATNDTIVTNDTSVTNETPIDTTTDASTISEAFTVKTVLNSTDCNESVELRRVGLEEDEVTATAIIEATTLPVVEESATVVDFEAKLNTATISPKISPEIESILNMTGDKEHDYDYDYNAPTLPPSLPNLRIIPFVAADALDTKTSTLKEVYPQDRISENFPFANHFSPPAETEGGFVPKEPPLLDNFYENNYHTTNIGTNSVTSLPVPAITNPPKSDENNCVVDGSEVKHGESIASEGTCAICVCFYGSIVCHEPRCPIPRSGCRNSNKIDRSTCCPHLICDDEESPTVVLDRLEVTSKSQEGVTVAEGIISQDPFRDVIRTEPAPDLKLLIGDMSNYLLKQSTTSPPTTTRQPSNATGDDLFSLDKIWQYLFAGGEDAKTEATSATPVFLTTTTTTTTPKPSLEIRTANHNVLETRENINDNLVRQPNDHSSVGLLKLAGCNIYGRMYRVGRIISELSGPCLECRCTEIGVQCETLRC